MRDLVLGADLGGTSTRVVIAADDGEIVGRGHGPGGNPVAHPHSARASFGSALEQALVGLDPARVRVGVVGMAGGGALRDPHVRESYDAAWRAAGLPDTPVVRPDLEVAFAAGSPGHDGSVLVAGTGAVVGEVRDLRLTRTIGGHGWLLGDEGAGFWVGREAVRSLLRALDGLVAEGPLATLVRDHLGVDGGDERAAVINASHAQSPLALAALSPLVEQAHRAGDPEAAAIVASAVDHLVTLWESLSARSDCVVLAGSLTGADTAVGESLRARLRQRGVAPHTAQEPVLGAVRLARSLDRS